MINIIQFLESIIQIAKRRSLIIDQLIVALLCITLRAMEQQFSCPGCKSQIQSCMLDKHVLECDRYPSHFMKQIKGIGNSSMTLDQLKFVDAQIRIAGRQIKNKISKENSKNKKPIIKKIDSKIDEPKINIDLSAYSHDIVQCKRCRNKFYSSFDTQSLFYVEECWHLFCINCVRKHIDNDFVNKGGVLACLADGCKKNIADYQIKELIGAPKFDAMMDKAIRKTMNIAQCFKCHEQYEFVPGNPKDAPKKDTHGKSLTVEHADHYAQNRFICQKADCKTQQCRQCQASPFHTGMTCKEAKAFSLAKKCRYCDEPLTEKNQSNSPIEAHKDICKKPDCQDLVKMACTKIQPCGHACCGIKGQISCIPCLNEKCAQNNAQLNGQSSQDYCNICFVEGLGAAPCIRSSCGHVFHYKCLQTRFAIKWITPRILFNFCLCPLCKKWISLPQQNPLNNGVKENAALIEKIQKMSLDRLKFQQCDKDQKLKDPKSPYYNKPTQYAMAIYAYFMCFKCKNPYFGGRKNCADAMNQAGNAADYKKQQLICPNCCQIPIQDCSKHGKDFIEFKCKFCCSTAQWFCWGNTHFCQPCHKRQCAGDYVSKYQKNKLPVCPGPGKCPIGGNHDGNGQQKTLGCAICRNHKQNSKAF